MEKRKLPGTDIELSRVGLGTWAMGGRLWGGADDPSAIRTLHAAIERGVTLIDTAPAYGFGHAEEIVGKAVAESGKRDSLVLATKAGLEFESGAPARNATAKRLETELEDSLRRLQTDYIDLYQIHWPDPLVEIEETAEAMARFYRDGKIRAIGVSNFSPEQCDRFREAAPLHTLQPPYNLFERDIDDDILPYAERSDLTLLTYGALCRGLLTGKMSEGYAFEGDDLRNKDPKFQPPRFAQYLGAVAALERLARERHDKSVLALAVRWILDRSSHTVALWGARRPAQVEPLDEIDGWSLTDADMADIDAILAEHVTDPIGPEFMAPPARQ
ncbi:aldo/keto reductase [Salinicola rhizosphaerae]|uniref:General stress protein 69 n=1 Tax=Salinicola rhizosphaerae TaxID=1443141 RepID=A0ABQ3EIS2_9GAMM|nr:aldo/keto reductase [Salinicola rhizosphaerae]GHB32077.1 general stress protein 69 [Salinicola rhizosphaerae]